MRLRARRLVDELVEITRLDRGGAADRDSPRPMKLRI